MLLGNANVSGSIFALLLVGFVVGIIAGAALMACCRRRKKTLLTCEQRFNSPEAPVSGHQARPDLVRVDASSCLQLPHMHGGTSERLRVLTINLRPHLLQTPGNDYTHQGVKHKKTQSALIRDDAVRRSGVTGPLGVGIVLQSMCLSLPNCSSLLGSCMLFVQEAIESAQE